MKFRVLFTALALLALTTFAFGQDPAQVWYGYPGDFNCADSDPLTYGQCWTGTPIPDGPGVYVFINDVEVCGPYDMNGGVMCGLEGFFFMETYCTEALEGDESYVEVRHAGCVYRSQVYTLIAGANEIYMFPADWVFCECEAPPSCVNILCSLDPEPPPCWDGQLFTATIWTDDPACDCDHGGTVYFSSDPPGADIAPASIDFPAESFFDVYLQLETFVGPGAFAPGECFTLIARVVFNATGCPDLVCEEIVCVDDNGLLYRYGGCPPEMVDVPDQMSIGDAYCFIVCHDVYWIPLTCQLPGPPFFQITPGCFDGTVDPCPYVDCVPGGPYDYCWDKVYCDGVWWLRFEYSNPYIEPVCYCVWFEYQLPVELNTFEAMPGNQMVTLNWTTASENNNERFEIARRVSETGDFVTIGELAGAGSKATETNYTYVDRNVANGVTYYYQLTAVDFSGVREVQDRIASATPSSTPGLVTDYALYPCYPNPFNAVTEIRYDVYEQGHVRLEVFDLLGRKVASLVNYVQAPDRYAVRFDASHLATGVYLYQLQVNDFTATKKMMLVK